MSSSETPPLTQLLNGTEDPHGDPARDAVSQVYDQLRQIAQKRMLGERKDHTLQATALVHEAYIKMAPQIDKRDWESRAQFFGTAAQAMRRILVNHARDRKRLKRGGNHEHVALNVVDLAEDSDPETILALDEAVERLEKKDPHYARLVQLRFYAGLSVEETAKMLDISERSVIRHWNLARAWLQKEIKKSL